MYGDVGSGYICCGFCNVNACICCKASFCCCVNCAVAAADTGEYSCFFAFFVFPLLRLEVPLASTLAPPALSELGACTVRDLLSAP